MTFPSSFWRLFFEVLKPSRVRLLFSYAFGVTGSLCMLSIPLFMRGFLNAMATPQVASVDVAKWLLYVCAARFAAFVFGRISFPLERGGITTAMVRLETVALDRVLRQSYRFFTDVPSGQVLAKIQKLPTALNQLHDLFYYTYLDLVVNFGFVLVLGFVRTPMLSVIVISYGLISSLIAWRASQKIRPIDRVMSETRSRLTGSLADILSQGITVLLFAGQDRERKRFDAGGRELVTAWKNKWMAYWRLMNWQRLLVVVFELSVLWIVFLGWREGRMTVGDVVMYQGVIAILIGQIRGFHDSIRRWHDATVEAQEAMDLLNREPDVQDVKGARSLRVTKGEIVFDGVSFGYSSKTGVVRDLSFAIRPGERLALVGRSGAGKSTVVKLLLRLYDVERGNILIDGQPIRKVKQASLREAVSYVPQEPLLFHRSVMENIRYGKPSATEKEVVAAAKKAFCHEFISRLPKGYDSLVGERGVKLSGGERQRVAIARAILKDAPILVLDEATSSLDPESEQYIQAAMAKLMEQKTVLVIAHRLSTIRHMDRVLVLDEGGIVDEGTHDVLLRKDSLYRDFWKRQTEGYKADA